MSLRVPLPCFEGTPSGSHRFWRDKSQASPAPCRSNSPAPTAPCGACACPRFQAARAEREPKRRRCCTCTGASKSIEMAGGPLTSERWVPYFPPRKSNTFSDVRLKKNIVHTTFIWATCRVAKASYLQTPHLANVLEKRKSES